ncbi:cysteine and histidine-rich domain-containing protein morgana [Phymastichus coffea]|uniref:cysteine and histidine-rich domain-containing protein morgana n=1 Tax=Phymastichus coffea TaxID=108790 RepID=UPI00273AB985|nr:cysteine and histidine-rich domain-containing protein morgana [Phymastichus coffea]
MSDDKTLLYCYNRGCGQKFDPNDNKEDICQHHPGHPVFHDAYKGWSCCNKKCTDFSEFLNIKGCTKSFHSNVKPLEPSKPVVDKLKDNEVIEYIPPSLNSIPAIERPPFNSPQVILKPTISPSLLEQIKGITVMDNHNNDENKIVLGQNCKNKSCKAVYKGLPSDEEDCTYHPGVPIFHEGLKYWSCCRKKTTDFSVFLEQPGCTKGSHLWVQKDAKNKKIKCRVDWHQTGTHVIISIYAKKYDPTASYVKLNPIHLTVDLYFPEENSNYNFDIELKGIVDVEASFINMLPTKVEINLRKKEPGSWSKLDIPHQTQDEVLEEPTTEDNISCQIDAVDLSDI